MFAFFSLQQFKAAAFSLAEQRSQEWQHTAAALAAPARPRAQPLPKAPSQILASTLRGFAGLGAQSRSSSQAPLCAPAASITCLSPRPV